MTLSEQEIIDQRISDELEIYKGALEDILTADETSTLRGALAIARHAMARGQDLHQPQPLAVDKVDKVG